MSYWAEQSQEMLQPLKHVCQINPETLPESTDPDFEFEYIDIGSVSLEAGIENRELMKFSASPSRARKPVRPGDIIISTVRTYLKAVAAIDSKAENWIASTGFAVLRPNPDIEARFLYRAVQANPFVETVAAVSTGVSYPAINPSTLGNIPVPIPSREKQRAIADYLDRETARIDQLIEKKQRLIALLDEREKSIVSSLVMRGLDNAVSYVDHGIEWRGLVPKHWTESRIKAHFRMSKRQGFPDLTVLSVYREFGVIEKDSRDDNINKTPLDLTNYQLVQPGDLVINKMKSWQGSLGISNYRGITSPDYVVMLPVGEHHPAYMHYLLRARPMPSVFQMISNGIRIDQWRMEPDRFLSLPVFLPPMEEQKEIAIKVEETVKKLRDLIEITGTSIELLREHRAALITASVTGQVDVSSKAVTAQAKPDRAALRVLVGAEIVHRHRNNRKFGRVKFQKEMYLAEAHAGISELEGSYLRKAAGPHDQQLMDDVEGGMATQGYYRADQPDGNGSPVTYVPLDNAGQHEGALKSALGSRADKLSAMIDLLRDFDTNAVEAIATLYAVWNDLLADGETPEDDAIIHHTLTEWHPEKSEKFTADGLSHWLGWMKRHDFVPTGNGPATTTGRLFV